MDINKPLVSIILALRNAERFIEECVKSILSQTYKNIEVVIVDDNSTDKSRSILRKLRKKSEKIRIIYNKKQYGIAVTLNRALRKSKGEFIAFIDSHDLYHKNKIKKQVEFLSENPKTAAVGTCGTLIDRKSKKCGKFVFPEDHSNIYQTLMTGSSMQFETAMINTTLLPKDIIHFQKNTYPLYFSETFIKLFPYGLFANITKPLYYKRHTPIRKWQKLKQYPSLLKLFLKSKTLYDYHGSIWSIFLPLKTLIRS